MFENNFGEYVKCAMQYEELTTEYTEKICEILTHESPYDNEWYYFKGFFRVDVIKKDYDAYMNFIENIVGCTYCHLVNADGLTFMISLSTLNMKI